MIDAVGNPQSILLLGGTSEIGLAVVEAFASDRPLRVVLAGRPSQRLTAARTRLEGRGCAVETVDFDAKAPETHDDAVRKCFASGDIDVAVVAFGLLGDAIGLVPTMAVVASVALASVPMVWALRPAFRGG